MGNQNKNYRNLGAGVNVDFGSDFGPDEILKYAQAAQGMSNAKAANARADAQLAMSQANQQFVEDTRAETKALENAFRRWSTHGIDNKSTGAHDPTATFNKDYDYDADFDVAWGNFQKELGDNADKTTFEAKWGANYQANLERAGRRYKAMRYTEGINNNIRDDDILDRHMQDKYGGVKLYEQLEMLTGNASTTMGFTPVMDPQNMKEKAHKLLFKETFTNEDGKTYGGGLTKIGAAAMFALPGAVPAYGAYKSFFPKGGQFKAAKDVFVKEADELKGKYKSEKKVYEKVKDKKTGKMVNKLNKKGQPIVKKVIPASGLSGGDKGDFKKTYGMLKSEAFDKNGKPSDKFLKAANKLARSQTTLGKQISFGKKYGIAAITGGLGSNLAEAAVEKMGGGEKTRIAASIGGGVGGAVGGHKLMKQIMKPSTMTRLLPILKKQAPKLAAKIALSAGGVAIPEVLSSIAGAGGLAWAAYDIYKLAKEVPAIMDVIFSEE